MNVRGRGEGNGQAGEEAKVVAGGLFADYRAIEGRYDEFLDGCGEGEVMWERFAGRVDELGREGLANSWRRGEELLRENGIAHQPFPDGEARRWDLDALPMLLGWDEWEKLSAGLAQRAVLLDRILRDCYRARNLVRNGVLPAALLFNQSYYNRALCGLTKQGERLLTFYAVDVARGPDGAWTVVADRTDAPNGTGFALENRIVLSQVFSETSKSLNLVRLASFFQSLGGMLRGLVSSAVDSPRVVMLGPGPGDPTYFEDAYLTRYLGITLVEGSELTVRGDRLFMKTVRGLERVHVLVRRIPGLEADPLETPTGSHAGVPGLMQAVRAGTLRVVNPPGTGILEAPAFLPYLPRLARELLGEELRLPSIETEWGSESLRGGLFGEGGAVVKSAFTRNLFPPVVTRELDAKGLADLEEAVRADPGRYVIQREMPFSTAPVWTGKRVEARPVALRLFLFAEGDGYRVMPGSLVRAASAPGGLPGLSLRKDTNSKDLWVVSRGQQASPVVTNLPARVRIRREAGNLGSLAADNMLWIGRHSERAEFATRIILEVVLGVTAEVDSVEIPFVPPLLRCLEKMEFLKVGEAYGHDGGVDRERLTRELGALFFAAGAEGREDFDSVAKALMRLNDVAALSRARLSNETWRIIQRMNLLVKSSPSQTLTGLRPPLQQAILLHSSFNGTCRENLGRTESWRFLNIGRRLERCGWLLTVVGEILDSYPVIEAGALEALLSIHDCTLTYRFRYQGSPQALATFDLLLFDPQNPRGLAYQLEDLVKSFEALPPPADRSFLRPPHRTLLRALNFLKTEVLQVDSEEEEGRAVGELREFVRDLRAVLPGVHEQLSWEFFAHVSFTSS